MSRIDPESLLYRVAIHSGLPAALSKRWLAKDLDRAANLRARGLVAELYRSADGERVFFAVVGPDGKLPRRPRPAIVLGSYRCLNVEEIVLHTKGGTGISRVLLHGTTVPDLEREVRGFEQSFVLAEAIKHERERPFRRRSS